MFNFHSKVIDFGVYFSTTPSLNESYKILRFKFFNSITVTSSNAHKQQHGSPPSVKGQEIFLSAKVAPPYSISTNTVYNSPRLSALKLSKSLDILKIWTDSYNFKCVYNI